MADAPAVHIGENSPEEVAYKLFRHVASVEGKTLSAGAVGGAATADRAWILKAYSDCITTVRNGNPPAP